MVGSGRIIGSRFSLTPSVPRFNLRVVNPETGGGYRRYPQPCNQTVRFITEFVDLGSPGLTWYRRIPNFGTYKQL
jgi:hypothetical protein